MAKIKVGTTFIVVASLIFGQIITRDHQGLKFVSKMVGFPNK